MLSWLLGTIFSVLGIVFIIFKHEVSFGLTLLTIGGLYTIAYKLGGVWLRLRDIERVLKSTKTTINNSNEEMEDFLK